MGKRRYEMKERYWMVEHNADTTETGMPQNRAYIKTVWEGFPAQQSTEQEIVEDFCRGEFGDKVAYVQGVAACQNWEVHESSEREYIIAKPINWGGYETETLKIVLGIGGPLKTRILLSESNRGA